MNCNELVHEKIQIAAENLNTFSMGQVQPLQKIRQNSSTISLFQVTNHQLNQTHNHLL